MKVFVAAALACCALAHLPAQSAPPAPMVFTGAHGGMLIAEPLGIGNRIYVAGGATVAVWQRNTNGAPVLAGDTHNQPVSGRITGLATYGDYLYASYQGYDASGVAVFSIANGDTPVLLGQYGDYSNAPARWPKSLAVVGTSLVLLDSEVGLFTASLANPARPFFTHSGDPVTYDRAWSVGNRLYTVGRTYISGTALNIFDVSNPNAVTRLGGATLDGFDNYRLRVKPPYAIGFGLSVNITDFSDPANLVQRGRIDAPVAYDGLLVGDYGWSVGGFEGLEVWSLANVDAPSQVGVSVPIDTFSTDVSTTIGNDGWLATRDDRVLRIDGTDPTQPTLGGTGLRAGGTESLDFAMKDGTALLLGNAFGLQMAEAGSLAPVGRYVTSLEQSLQGRAFEGLALDGNRAYLGSWGAGLVIADVTDPRRPVELGRYFYEFGSTVAARGNYAYLGRTTNGGELVILDVSNPADPSPVGVLTSALDDKFMRIALHGNYAFIADQPQMGTTGGGLRIVDIHEPTSPTDVALFTDCGAPNDVALDQTGKLAALACSDATWLVDVTDPTHPVALGNYPGNATAIALRGDRAYIGTDDGVSELDISNRASPTLVTHRVTQDVPRRIAATADGRIYVMHGLLGTWVYTPDRLHADGFEAH